MKSLNSSVKTHINRNCYCMQKIVARAREREKIWNVALWDFSSSAGGRYI